MFIKLHSSLETNLPVSIAYDTSSINTNVRIIYAAFVLIGLYILIIFEVIM